MHSVLVDQYMEARPWVLALYVSNMFKISHFGGIPTHSRKILGKGSLVTF